MPCCPACTQEGLAVLHEALQNLLLHESSQLPEGRSQVSYFLAHNKIREVISFAAGDVSRRVFHKRALAVLKCADTTAASLTYQTLSSGLQESSPEKFFPSSEHDFALLLHPFLRGANSSDQVRYQVFGVGGTQTGDRVPARPCVIARDNCAVHPDAVITLGDIVKVACVAQ